MGLPRTRYSRAVGLQNEEYSKRHTEIFISSNTDVLCVLWVLDQHNPALCVPAKASFGSIATNGTIKFHICVGFHFLFL